MFEIEFHSPARTIRFSRLVQIVRARTLDEVLPAIREVQQRTAAGFHAAGYISYEAAPAFDPAMQTHGPGALPLVEFGIYRGTNECARASSPHAGTTECATGEWTPQITREEYLGAVARIRELIAAGDTYQVNFTFPLRAPFRGDQAAWFQRMRDAQHSEFGAFIRTGDQCILSTSPELFFRLDGHAITCRPMKGTSARGLWPEADRCKAQRLASSAKDRAENVMIVDLIRSDLGRIAECGSVEVKKLFELERYPTVWQMTSTIEARTFASFPEILRALFPSGSVTGAPKIRTMQIIRELERVPRGIYCGAIGWWTPDGRAQFSVAIRTAILDLRTQEAEYFVGSGITYSSDPAAEYDECMQKAKMLSHPNADFELIESLRYDGEFFLLREHMDRVAASAAHFGFPLDVGELQAELQARAQRFSRATHSVLKVRVIVRNDGMFRIEQEPAKTSPMIRLGFAAQPVDRRDPFLYHKTTRRESYERARESRPDCEDVLLWNEEREITESTAANVVLVIGGEHLTPPIESGLLGGTLRTHMLQAGTLREARLMREDIRRASSIYLINSVRKHIPVEWIPGVDG